MTANAACRDAAAEIDMSLQPLVFSRPGRILLHVIAMLGDRQWRWHLAGVVRELN
jgi:hypothetical protein